MPKSWIAIGHRHPIKFAVKSAYGFATDTFQVPRLIQGQGEDRVRLLRILDTWNRANLVSSNLCRRQTFKIITRPRQHPPVFVFVLTLSSLPCLTYFPSPSPYFFYRASLPTIVSSLHNWNRCAISTSVVYLRRKEINGDR